MTSTYQKRLIILGEERGRPFLLLPRFFRPTWQPKWWKSYPFRADICIVSDPTDQAVRALNRSVFKEVTRQHIKVIHKTVSRGCAPRVKWTYCLVTQWTDDALVRIPPEMKFWLVDEHGVPYQFYQTLCTEAQVALQLIPRDRLVAA